MAEQVVGSAPRGEKTTALFETLGLPPHQLEAVSVRGILSGLDLSDCTCSNCVFRDVTFSRCLFSSGTRFVSCKFEGRFDVDDPGSFGMVEWNDSCQFSPAAYDAFQRSAGTKKVPVTEPLILDTFHLALSKFRRPHGFKSLDSDNLNRGPIAHSPLRADIWELLEKHDVIAFHHISGLGSRSGVSISKECMHEVRRFLDNSLVVGKLELAVKEIKRKFLPIVKRQVA